ncbi:hypothetical protein [Glutamicibacter sp. AOP5-A2-18]|uniref:hypothetical protein n=1 Tax=Glutamicibacter sp. AOP5-A2-18 TaxID=3457656 RepID=UPI0040343AE4
MARNININLRDGSGGTADNLMGSVSIEPTQPFNAGPSTVLPSPQQVELNAGVATLVAVEPTPEGDTIPWAYRVTMHSLSGVQHSIIVGVPNLTTPVNLTDLPIYAVTRTYEGEAHVLLNKETGPRDVRSLWGGTGGKVTLTRSGNWVELSVWGVPYVSANQYQMQVPAGFRPPDIRLFNEAVYGDGNPAGERVNVRSDGNLQILGVTTGAQIYFTIHWYTKENMPSTLPGNAV